MDTVWEDLVVNIIEPYNAIHQAISRHAVCVDHPEHPYIQNLLPLPSNIYNWTRYFMTNKDALYSKGRNNLNIWMNIPTHPTCVSMTSNELWFVLSASMIILQVYGDGNHRTASNLFHRFTGLSLPLEDIGKLRMRQGYSSNEYTKMLDDLHSMFATIYLNGHITDNGSGDGDGDGQGRCRGAVGNL